jgi:hypothetical protein
MKEKYESVKRSSIFYKNINLKNDKNIINFLREKCISLSEEYGYNEQDKAVKVNKDQKIKLQDILKEYIDYVNKNISNFKISDKVLSQQIESYNFKGLYSYLPQNIRTYYFNHKMFLDDLETRKYI